MKANKCQFGSGLRVMVLSCFLMSFAAISFAQTYRSAVVNMKDGTVTKIELEDGLATQFTETTIDFVGDDSTLSLNKEDVSFISFSELSGISKITDDSLRFSIVGNTLYIAGLADGSNVAVYDIAGRCLSNTIVSGDFEISLNGLSTGVCIVNVNGVSYKIGVK